MAVQLAAPHTWVASIYPCLVGVCAAAVTSAFTSVTMAIALLLISVLMQSAANTFNDYFDFVKGADSADDNVEISDATLVYNNINPRSALVLAIGFLVVALAIGVYVIIEAGWVPLAIGIVGAIVVVCYSFGKTPVSYLPISELVSGVVMGGLIMIASYYCMAASWSWTCLVWSIPTIIGVALVMLTNNTCDIEKDIDAKRKTFPAIVGRDSARTAYKVAMILWMISISSIIAIWFTPGLLICVFMILGAWPFMKNLWNNPMEPESRIAAMGQICTLNAVLGIFYSAALLASWCLNLII
ncbi:MAG: prenyltransferase [bacterium]|nr:prenyltransferase [bacterium]